jgi:hypothetical protein
VGAFGVFNKPYKIESVCLTKKLQSTSYSFAYKEYLTCCILTPLQYTKTLRQGPKDPVLSTLVKMPYYKRKNNRVTKRRRKEKKEIERNNSWKKV